MIHTFDLDTFCRMNYNSLCKMAASCLRPPFDDSDIHGIISQFVIDAERTGFLSKYTPVSCKKYGITFSSAVYRQLKHVLAERAQRAGARKRVLPDVREPFDPTRAFRGLYEHLSVSEFMGRLEPHLEDLVRWRMTGETGMQYAVDHGLSYPAIEKRMKRVRERWHIYNLTQ